MAQHLAGMYAALMTAFSDDGAFDPARQSQLNVYVLGQGLTGLYVGGSSGESGLLDAEELLAQQEVVAADAKGSGAKLIAHVGLPNLRDSIRLARRAEALGYDGLSALPPHSYPFSDREILGYYRDLAQATALPLIVYEVPIRTGRPIGLETLVEIMHLPNVAGIKFTSTDLFKFSMLRRRCPGKLFYFGFDEIYLTGGILGANGGIGTTYNLLGGLYAALDAALRANQIDKARALQDASQIFVEALLDIGVLPGMKAAFRSIGLELGLTRAPMAERVADAEARMRTVLARPEIACWVQAGG